MPNPFIDGNINSPDPFIGAGNTLLLKTAESMYRYFLHVIRKEKTIIVTPDDFRKYINPAALNWVKSKLPLHQFNQKRIHDLQILHVDVDGVFHPLIPAKGSTGGDQMLFQCPFVGNSVINGYEYPPLLHGIAAEFKIMYKNNSCYPDGISQLLPAKYLKTDSRAFSRGNVYARPEDNRLFYEYVNNTIRLATGLTSGTSKSYGVEMRLEYYRYPKEIVYDSDPEKCQDSEFDPQANLEIIEIAVIDYLESKSDQRLPTFSQVERSKEAYK